MPLEFDCYTRCPHCGHSQTKTLAYSYFCEPVWTWAQCENHECEEKFEALGEELLPTQSESRKIKSNPTQGEG